MQYCLKMSGKDERFLSMAAPLGKGWELVTFSTLKGAESFARELEETRGWVMAVFPVMGKTADGTPFIVR